MRQSKLIYCVNESGAGSDVMGVIGTLVDTQSFFLESGNAFFNLVFVKDGLTSFTAKPWLRADDGTWCELLDYNKASVSVFGTISASVTGKSYHLYLGGPRAPAGVEMKLVFTYSGTPTVAGNDAIRLSYAEAV